MIPSATTFRRWAGACALATVGGACLRQAVSTAPAPARHGLSELRQTIDSLVALPAFRNAQWGVLMVDPQRGDTLYSRNAGKLFMPASNMKLVTTGVALTTLGLDYRYVTTLAARGPVVDGALHGDLLVFGRGDPTVSDQMRGDAMAPLRDMADSLYAAGIRRIVGGVRLGADVFPGPTLGDGWMWDDLDTPDGAAVDELLFNDGVGVLHVTPASTPGQAPSVTTTPARSYPMVNVLARTVSAGDTVLLRADPLRAVKDTASNAMNVFGTIEVGDSAKLAIAFSSPDRAYLAALREALSDRGISVGDSATDTTAAVDSLVRVSSPTLRDILPAMLKPSQNQIAEMLLRTVALVSTGVGRADSARRVEREQLLAWGASPDGFVLRDGSGLTRYDLLSPETIMRVLDAIRRSPSYEDVYAALPVAGVDGTLKNRMRGATPGSVHAKTGSLTGVRALSGYITADDGRTLMFSIICNNFTTPVGLVLDVEDSLVTRLATLRVR